MRWQSAGRALRSQRKGHKSNVKNGVVMKTHMCVWNVEQNHKALELGKMEYRWRVAQVSICDDVPSISLNGASHPQHAGTLVSMSSMWGIICLYSMIVLSM